MRKYIGVRRRSARGQVLPITALLLMVIMGVGALALNVGNLTVTQTSEQKAVDASALAAAFAIHKGDSMDEAQAIANMVASQNELSANPTVIFNNAEGQPATSASTVVSVTVKASESKSPIAGYFLNTSGKSNVAVAATASVGGSGVPICGMCVLNNSSNPGIELIGDSSITVVTGGIAVDSTSDQALTTQGAATLNANGPINIVGGVQLSGGSTISPAPTTGAAALPNPLQAVPAPVVSGSMQTVPANFNGSINPGVYSSISEGNNSVLTLNPGIYVIEGSLSLSGTATLNASSGVMLYFTCPGYSTTNTEPCNGTSSGNISIGSGTTFDLTAPSSGNYQGIALMVDPNDPNQIDVSGNATIDLNGTIYAPDSELYVTGNGNTAQLNSVIIVNTVYTDGSGQITLNSTEQANAPAVYDGGLPALIA